MNEILDSTKFVVGQSSFVKINTDKVIEYAKRFEHGSANHWLSQAPFDYSHFDDEQKLRFTFIFNALSFCYWGDPKWTIQYKDKLFDGAWGMAVALGRGIKEGFPLLDWNYCSKIDESDLTKILRANTKIPLFKERLEIFREIGTVMSQKYSGDIDSLLRQANNDALKLLEIIVRDFPSFNDVSLYKGKRIFFYKRAQLLASDLYQALNKRGISCKNVEQLTACADYKLPQILRRFGIFEYSSPLTDRIDRKIEIPHDSQEEIEIRANTVWAVEFIKEQILKRNSKITSMQIDDHLWLASQEKFPDEKPYHRTQTTTY